MPEVAGGLSRRPGSVPDIITYMVIKRGPASSSQLPLNAEGGDSNDASAKIFSYCAAFTAL